MEKLSLAGHTDIPHKHILRMRHNLSVLIGCIALNINSNTKKVSFGMTQGAFLKASGFNLQAGWLVTQTTRAGDCAEITAKQGRASCVSRGPSLAPDNDGSTFTVQRTSEILTSYCLCGRTDEDMKSYYISMKDILEMTDRHTYRSSGVKPPTAKEASRGKASC
ncbi:uncharacterized protein LOC143706211 [Siphateles boraxobius]|uniref:uncharacterized protein LOC143706211 n=1 Tax=Siphateles boraxobius TaxID=180520 RepID=UPI004063F74F